MMDEHSEALGLALLSLLSTLNFHLFKKKNKTSKKKIDQIIENIKELNQFAGLQINDL